MSDLFYSEQWYLREIHAQEAWETTTGSRDVIVAVLDAGFDLDHEDLIGQFWLNQDEVANNNRDDDQNGFEDDVQGWDFVDSDSDVRPDTSDPFKDHIISHGTLLSGIIGAITDNGLGIAGINHHVSIMPLRVLDANGTGSSSDVEQAIRYAVENGAQVINLSFTFDQPDERLRETLVWAHDQGVTIVASVGNDNIDTDTTSVYPACYDKDVGKNFIIGVASIDTFGHKADFSNFGSVCTDLVTPGTNIFGAAYNDPSSFLLSTSYGGPWEGTSVSAPIVSAAVALLKAGYPSLTPDQVRNVLKLSVDPVQERSAEARRRLGAGKLNIARALSIAGTFANVPGYGVRSASIVTTDSFVVAQGHGGPPIVKRVNGQGETLVSFSAYHPNFHGGVRLAMGDVTGNAQEEIITGAGPGGGPQVRVFDLSGNPIAQFFAFETEDRSGIFVATGDIDNDGVDEIIVSRDTGGTGQVRIFNKAGQLKGAFYPFGRVTSAITVALTNLDDDPAQEIVVGAIIKGENYVSVFDGSGRYVRSIRVEQNFASHLYVSSGDLDGDKEGEIILSGGKGSAPRVHVFSQSGEWIQSFDAYAPGMLAGVQAAVGDRDADGRAEIATVALTGGGPHVRVFTSQAGVITSFFAFDQKERNGLFVAR